MNIKSIQVYTVFHNVMVTFFNLKFFFYLQIHEVVKYLKQGLMDRLDAVQWMEKSSRTIAVQKVRAIVDKIGYPTWMANDDVIDQMYSSVSLSKASYWL